MPVEYGIHGFVYYHYWFHGRRLLERPFEEVLSSGHPDFPFALCWANEEWTRNWDAQSGNVLVEQRFSEADDLAHIRWLVRAFADERYIKIDGRPLMLVYRSDLLPDPKRTTDLWRRESQAAGFPDVYLAMVESRRNDDDPRPIGLRRLRRICIQCCRADQRAGGRLSRTPHPRLRGRPGSRAPPTGGALEAVPRSDGRLGQFAPPQE